MCVNIIFVHIRVCARHLLTSHRLICYSFCVFLLEFDLSIGTPLTGALMDSENIDHSCFSPIGMCAGTLLKLIKRACLGTSFSVTFRWETFKLLSNSTQAWNKVSYSSKVLERKFWQHATFFFFLLTIRGRINFHAEFGGRERQISGEASK